MANGTKSEIKRLKKIIGKRIGNIMSRTQENLAAHKTYYQRSIDLNDRLTFHSVWIKKEIGNPNHATERNCERAIREFMKNK